MAKHQKTKKWRGRGLDESALTTVKDLIQHLPMRRDLLIEYLHLIQDSQHCLPAPHIHALAAINSLIRLKKNTAIACVYSQYRVLVAVTSRRLPWLDNFPFLMQLTMK